MVSLIFAEAEDGLQDAQGRAGEEGGFISTIVFQNISWLFFWG